MPTRSATRAPISKTQLAHAAPLPTAWAVGQGRGAWLGTSLVAASLLLGSACGDDDASDESVMATGGSSSMASGGSTSMAPSAPEEFASAVHPIFTQSCVPCHAAGEHADDSADIAYEFVTSAIDEGTFMTLILDRIGPEAPQLGTAARMPLGSCNGPPGTSGCVSEAEYDVIRSWYDTWFADSDI